MVVVRRQCGLDPLFTLKRSMQIYMSMRLRKLFKKLKRPHHIFSMQRIVPSIIRYEMKSTDAPWRIQNNSGVKKPRRSIGLRNQKPLLTLQTSIYIGGSLTERPTSPTTALTGMLKRVMVTVSVSTRIVFIQESSARGLIVKLWKSQVGSQLS